MTDAFEERRRKQEEKWAHDEAQRFKVKARRDKLLGLWAAAEMGLSGPHADAYAASLVAADLHGKGEAVLDKLRADFATAKLGHSDAVIRHKMEELLVVAAGQLKQA
ncbi:MAG: DUF1476 domain-containing protein [Alphaproteobacteria bacterium]|nr:DUF1476 domain-containing protein [Alphaproteobacteria bacterium]